MGGNATLPGVWIYTNAPLVHSHTFACYASSFWIQTPSSLWRGSPTGPEAAGAHYTLDSMKERFGFMEATCMAGLSRVNAGCLALASMNACAMASAGLDSL